MNITYHTVAVHLPPTPLGLLGERWAIEHQCTTCRQQVGTDELIDHARHHHAHGIDDNLPIAAPVMHNGRRQDRHHTPNDIAPVLPASTTDTHQQRR